MCSPWGALNGPARVALLGHELGHFVNGDVRRGPVTQPALTMLGNAADLFRPRGGSDGGGLLVMVGEWLGHLASWTPPPTGLRHRMLGARPWQDPAVTLTEARAARIDAELAGHYERAGRALSWNA
ncbi:hypothetical protein [Micromonospora aurantiaca (nom. illeg.)]|uniref:hypothetical protein n=1 Tax=Micromonospora aurantiaca (nom. illeg.) TaxID=47850 RepID=UPI00340B880C